MTSPVCPECGAVLESPEAKCWLCGSREAATSAPTLPEAHAPEPQPDAGPAPRYNPWAISLQSIWIIVTLLCVMFGVMAVFPGLGIALLVISVPAVVRSLMLGNIWRAAGRPLTLGEKALSLMGSLAVVTLVVVATSVAFCVVCFPLGLSQFEYPGPGGFPILMVGAFVAGGAAGIAVAVGLINALWVQPVRRWRASGILPSWRQRTQAFLAALGQTMTMLAGAAGGAFLCVLPFTLSTTARVGPSVRALWFALLLVGMLAGGTAGWFLHRKWPRFFAIMSIFALSVVVTLWMFSGIQAYFGRRAAIDPQSDPLGPAAATALGFLLVICVPPLAATAAYWLWRWSEEKE